MFQGFEPYSTPLLPVRTFAGRVARHAALAFAIIGLSLLLGMLGYHWLEQLDWLDAFLNAAMLLGGMGPVAQLKTSAGKIFAGCYALFSGLVFLGAVSVLLAPIIHRFQHRYHLDMEAGDDADDDKDET